MTPSAPLPTRPREDAAPLARISDTNVRRAEVVGGLALTGAATGAALGVTLLGATAFASGAWPSGPVPEIIGETVFIALAGGGAGVAFGTVAAPVASFAVLRDVPLGRALVHTAAGTLLGGLGALAASLVPAIGSALAPFDGGAPNPFVTCAGALAGFVAGVVTARLATRRARRRLLGAGP